MYVSVFYITNDFAGQPM